MGGVSPQTTQQLSTTNSIEKHVVTTFDDEKPVVASTIPSSIDHTFSQSDARDAEISKFLARPVLIENVEWDVGSPLETIISPMSSLLSNPQIQKKLANYAFLRADIKLKFVINSTQFNYGCLLISYVPRIRAMAGSPYVVTPTDTEFSLIFESQQPRVYLDIGETSSAEVTFPFFYPKNYFDLKNDDPTEYCMATIRELPGGLRVATSEATSRVDISVYAWFENISLAGPTYFEIQSNSVAPSNNELQMVDDSEKEYTQDSASSVAYALSKAMGKLTSSPIIGPYAFSTSIFAKGIGDIASAFGFSKPTFSGDYNVTKLRSTGSSANTNGNDTARKLTYDHKQQTTIDPRIAGLPPNDDMLLATIFGRETYIGNVDWSMSNDQGDILGFARVTPVVRYYDTGVTPVENRRPLVYSSLGYGTFPFNYWSGTIHYRLKVIASKYHKGRLRISYDPLGNAPGSTAFNPVYSYVVDLDTCREIDFSVSWCSALPYLEADLDDGFVSGSPAPDTQGPNANGTIFVSVLNQLSAPINTADLKVLLFHKGGEDYEVFDPKYNLRSIEKPGGMSNFPIVGPESSSAALCKEDTIIRLVGEPDTNVMNKKGLIFHGDPIISLRQLLKRYELHTASFNYVNSGSDDKVKFRDLIHTYPTFQGFTARRIADNIGSTPTPFVGLPTSLLAYFSAGYAGYRGGVRFKVRCYNGSGVQPSNYVVCRGDRFDLDKDTTVLDQNAFNSDLGVNLSFFNTQTSLAEGAEIALQQNESVVEFEVPYYSPYRFIDVPIPELYEANGDWDAPTNASLWKQQFFVFNVFPQYERVAAATSNARNYQYSTSYYSSAAEDYNLIWYLGCPFMASQ